MKRLELPEYYGNNLDALWNCITGWIDLSIKLEWLNFNESQDKLGDYVQKLLEVFKEADEEIDGFK
ncbi:barstar family protein [uncultured Clostridium sp.]|uniref:barstar family protein n=1 Tax=uncultured Clostridium sp. TaxID=59620 RepID=UPI0037DC810F